MRYTIKVNNETESKLSQEILFKLGYKWKHGSRVFFDIVEIGYLIYDDNILVITFINNDFGRLRTLNNITDNYSFEQFINKVEHDTRN